VSLQAATAPAVSRPPWIWGRGLVLLGLVGPAVAFSLVILIPSLALLLVNSAYHFDRIRVVPIVTFEAYRTFFTDIFFARIILTQVRLAVVTTLICLLLGYPAAYAIAKIRRPAWVMAAYILVFSPLLTSSVVRAYGWLIILARGGIVNWGLQTVGLVESPVRLVFNFTGVVIGLVHFLLPFTIFPIISVLLRLDPALKEAAADLGATRLRTFRHVTWPLSFPGVYAAAQLTFVLSMNAFVTPQLLGGGRVLVLPVLIYNNISDLQWPLAAVQALALIALVWTTVFSSNLIFRRALAVSSGAP